MTPIYDRVQALIPDVTATRMEMRGSMDRLTALFAAALCREDSPMMAHLFFTRTVMEQEKDSERDFSTTPPPELEPKVYFNIFFSRLHSLIDTVTREGYECLEKEMLGIRIMQEAANRGSHLAQYHLLRNQWLHTEDSLGLALALHPFLESDVPVVRRYALSLMYGSNIGHPLFYQGMCLLIDNGGITVKYPPPGETVAYLQRQNVFSTFQNIPFSDDGKILRVSNGTIFCSSPELWDRFVSEKLTPLPIDIEALRIDVDEEALADRCRRFKVSCCHSGGSIEDPDGIRHGRRRDGSPAMFSTADRLSVYAKVGENRKRVGEVEVIGSSGRLLEFRSEPEFQDIMHFIRAVMVRTGSAKSASNWIEMFTNNFLHPEAFDDDL